MNQARIRIFVTLFCLASLGLAGCGNESPATPTSSDNTSTTEDPAAKKKRLAKLDAQTRTFLVNTWHRDAEDFRDRLTVYSRDQLDDFESMSLKKQTEFIDKAHELASKQKAEIVFRKNGRFELSAYNLPPYPEKRSKKTGSWRVHEGMLHLTTTSINGKPVTPEPMHMALEKGLLYAPNIEPFGWIFRRAGDE